MKILADATLPKLTELFPSPFNLTLYSTQDELADLLRSQDILLCRSTLQVSAELLANSQIQCVATASSGIDHIDSDYLKKHGIYLFDAKGCNARAVADYVVATLALLFQNQLIFGNKAGVIGVGKVGEQVVTRLQAAGFEVICYDPIKAMPDPHHQYCSFSELTTCDVLCIHANLHETPPYPSANLITSDFLSKLKSKSVIINAARGGIVNEAALLATDFPITYCTDVYQNEPEINPDVVDFATLCTPHIAGHSIEAKNAAVQRISQQLHHHYGLSMTMMQSFPKIAPVILPPQHNNPSSWIDDILSIYNPLKDTQTLKTAINKKQAYLKQRKEHKNRHDFNCYESSQQDLGKRKLLGFY